MSNLPVRLVGVSSSPRHGNTEALLNEALNAAKEAYPEITVEMVSMKGKVVKPCLDCKACEKRRGDSLLDQCVQKDDWKEIVKPLIDPVPNGIILASPVYFSDVNAQMRAFMERFTSLSKPHWNKDLPFEVPDFSKTVGGALTVGFHRNGGQETTILNMLQFFTIQGMLSVGSVCPKYGSIGYYGGIAWEDAAGEQGRTAVKEDQWGLYSARVVGRNVARTALMLAKAPDVPVVVEPFVSPHGDAKTK